MTRDALEQLIDGGRVGAARVQEVEGLCQIDAPCRAHAELASNDRGSEGGQHGTSPRCPRRRHMQGPRARTPRRLAMATFMHPGSRAARNSAEGPQPEAPGAHGSRPDVERQEGRGADSGGGRRTVTGVCAAGDSDGPTPGIAGTGPGDARTPAARRARAVSCKQSARGGAGAMPRGEWHWDWSLDPCRRHG